MQSNRSISQVELHSLITLTSEVTAWSQRGNRTIGFVEWQFTNEDACRKLNGLSADRHFQRLQRQGIQATEPGDGLAEEQPQRLTRLVLRAVAEDIISPTRAAELLLEINVAEHINRC